MPLGFAPKKFLLRIFAENLIERLRSYVYNFFHTFLPVLFLYNRMQFYVFPGFLLDRSLSICLFCRRHMGMVC